MGTVHERRGNPQHERSGVRHQVSQATQKKDSVCFFHHSVNVLLSTGMSYQRQSFTFFHAKKFLVKMDLSNKQKELPPLKILAPHVFNTAA